MVEALGQFHVFTKPMGAICNLDCDYCYYLKKEHLYRDGESFHMPDDILEEYILQLIDASSEQAINFLWHGGEPTLLGLDYFRKIVALQHRHKPPERSITNSMQTNGTLIDEEWCRFLEEEDFSVGLSLDGPLEMHDRHRLTRGRKPTHRQVMRGYKLLRRYRIPCDILCVVNANNVQYPTAVYRFFKKIKAQYLGFLPLVEPQPETEGGVSVRTVSAEAFGHFLCTIYDEWLKRDIGRVKVQIFEEIARRALGHEHTLCIFRETCGNVPVVEHNGDFFSCDHFVDPEHRFGNIQETPLAELIESPSQRAFGHDKWNTLPRYCKTCDVRVMCNGGCPKDRISMTPDGEEGLNYLCTGYKRFFTHTRSFASQLGTLQGGSPPYRGGRAHSQGVSPFRKGKGPIDKQISTIGSPSNQAGRKTGRNDPCPCGSGRKYKKCCLGRP